jgi:hypothetical protein
MRVMKYTGYVGIGTAVPNAYLEVNNKAAFNSGAVNIVGIFRTFTEATGTESTVRLVNSSSGNINKGVELSALSTNSVNGQNDFIVRVHGGGGAAGALNPRMRLYSGTNKLTIGDAASGVSGKLELYSEQGVTDYTTIFQPGTQTQNVVYTLPVDDGTANQVLTTDGGGVLSWATGGGGATGPTGPTGAAGVVGPTGPAGTNGAVGATGPAGTNGTNGTNGSVGATGPAGPAGAAGPTGAAGTNGTNGANGAVGATGPAGTNGAVGATGPAGAAGPTGSAGSNGTNGTNGTNGVTGSTGPTGPTWTLTTPTYDATGTLTINATAGSGAPVTTVGQAWLVGGNTFGSTSTGYKFGTISNDHVDLFSNNIVRGRLSNLGEFFIGTTNTVITGDLMAAQANATFPWAVNGYTTQAGSGVYGSVQSGASAYSAIEGAYLGTGAGSGVYGNNQGSGSGAGVNGSYVGSATGTTSPTGVLGYCNPSIVGNTRIGVYGAYNGAAHWGIGVAGIGLGGALPAGNNDIAVVGWRANNANYSGYFNGNHVIANGTKSASVGTTKGNQLLYVTETPGVWFEDIGAGKLVNGKATVELDPLFLEAVQIDDAHPMHVFIQVNGECNEVYVQPGKTSFQVVEKRGGTSNVDFSYRIMAKRLHFADHRFGNDPVWGPGDTRKYNTDATPRPIDYEEGVRFDEAQKAHPTPSNYPAGFIVPSTDFKARPVDAHGVPLDQKK